MYLILKKKVLKKGDRGNCLEVRPHCNHWHLYLQSGESSDYKYLFRKENVRSPNKP
jgi:hypothetical protein